jgi:hypothetical protein
MRGVEVRAMRARTKLEHVAGLVLLSSMVWLSGRATEKVAGDEGRAALEADRKQAASECVRAALSVSDSGEVLMPYVVDRDVYTRCVEARGYTTTTR